MRHIISVLMADEAGALVRVAGVFSQRGFNITTLNVAPTETPGISRLTLVTTGTESVVEQINRQLLKLVDVIDVEDMSAGGHRAFEMALLKTDPSRSPASLESLIADYDVQIIHEEEDRTLLRFLGSGDHLNHFVATLAEAGILVELARSGTVTMMTGQGGMSVDKVHETMTRE